MYRTNQLILITGKTQIPPIDGDNILYLHVKMFGLKSKQASNSALRRYCPDKELKKKVQTGLQGRVTSICDTLSQNEH